MIDPPMDRIKVSGLYAITPDIENIDRLCEMAYHVLAGGVSWLQYRNKKANSRLRLMQALEIHLLCKQFQVPLIINDHMDLVMEIDAEGLHVGGEDTSVAAARHYLGQNKIIGVSCYNQLSHAIEAEKAGADYVAFGAFYPSMTKIDAYQAPIHLLDAAKKTLNIPIVAIGGINLDNAEALIARGCDAVAVSQALFSAQDIQSAARHFSKLFC